MLAMVQAEFAPPAAALLNREALNPTWADGPNGAYDSAAFKAQIEEAARRPGKVVRNDGDAETRTSSTYALY